MAGTICTCFENTHEEEPWDGSLKTSELGPVLNYSPGSLAALSCDPAFGLYPREHGLYHRDDVETFLRKRRRYPLLLKFYPPKSKNEWCAVIRSSYLPWRNRLPEGCGVVVFDTKSHDLLLVKNHRGQSSISINLQQTWSRSANGWIDDECHAANAATDEYLVSVVAFVIGSLKHGIYVERLFYDDEQAVFTGLDDDAAEGIRCSFDAQREIGR